jgi:thioredoxin reductase
MRADRLPSFDVVIAGAGPAGLSAALVLGRAQRTVLLCDTDEPRSWASRRMHAFVTREGISPQRFRRLAREELGQYPNVCARAAEVTEAHRQRTGGFRVVVARNQVACRKLLIATGVRDILPPLDRVEEFFGKSVFQCPYCDGWEMRDTPTAVYGKRKRGFELARAMTAWSHDIVLCTDGPSGLTGKQRKELARNGIAVNEERIASLTGTRGRLKALVFESGKTLPRSSLFFDLPTRAHSTLGESLGCQLKRHGRIVCGQYEATDVPGVFVAGNVIDDVQLAIVAAAEGARAAFGINRALTREDFEQRATGTRSVEHPDSSGPAPKRR